MLSSAYGLFLHSNLSIPGLVDSSSTSEADVQVWMGVSPPWRNEFSEADQEAFYISPDRDEQGTPNLTVWTVASGHYFRFLYQDGTEFHIDRLGTRVWATWPSTLTLEDTAPYLLGPILGFLLRLGGVTSLHASAVAIDGEAIALVGLLGAKGKGNGSWPARTEACGSPPARGWTGGTS